MRIAVTRLGRLLFSAIQQDMSDDDALDFQSLLLQNIVDIEALGVLIDISALDTVDSFMARVINDTASMARLLGTEVMVCGIQPFVALSLVEMGQGLLSTECSFSLEQGLDKLNHRIALRGDFELKHNEFEARFDSHRL
jgi:rsbT antagonist protein RsbS